jgi:PAS domain S-box-containing protein
MDNEPDTTAGARGVAAPDDFAVVIDARGAVTMWSAGAGRLLGYEREEVVGRQAAGLLAARLPFAMRRRLAAREPWTSDVVLRNRTETVSPCRSGARRWRTCTAPLTGSSPRRR